MSAIPKSSPLISVGEYLRAEAAREERHEYLGGYVYPMVQNTTMNHVRIQNNLYKKLDAHLTPPCEALTSGVKAHVETPDAEHYFYYPDVLVTCDEEDDAGDTIESPKILAEVLSPSTERVDTREKWFIYRFNPAVQEILLLYQDRVGGRIARRSEGDWRVEMLEDENGTLKLDSIGLEFPLAELYAGVSWFEA